MTDENGCKDAQARQRGFHLLPAISIFAAVYFCLGELSLFMAQVKAGASAIWLPTGMALAVLLLWGWRLWPGIFAGSFLVNFACLGGLGVPLGIASGRTVEALAAVWLVCKFANGINAFLQSHSIVKFILLAAVISTTVGASIGVTSLCLGGFTNWNSFFTNWITWWLSDLTSNLLVTPLLVIWVRVPWPPFGTKRILEGFVLLLMLGLFGSAVFLGKSTFPSFETHAWLMIPLLLWAAIRFERRGAIASAFVVLIMAAWGTQHGTGPFVTSNRIEGVLNLQIFVGTTTMASLVLVAIISEHRLVEAAARESENRYWQVLKEQTDVISRFKKDGTLVFANEAYRLFFGSPQQDVMWTKGHPQGVAADLPSINEKLSALSPDNPVMVVENRVCNNAGEMRWMQFVHRAIFNAAGQHVETQSSGRDITEQRLAQMAQMQLAAIVNSSDIAVIGNSLEGLITSWNPGAEKLYGYASGEVIGRPVALLFPPEHAGELAAILARIAKGESVEHFETSQVRKDGQRVVVSMTISPIKDSAGSIVGVSKMARDITESRRLAEMARSNEERYRSLAESSPDAIYVLDRHSVYQYLNHTAARWHDKPVDELVGHAREEFLPEGIVHSQQALLDRAFETGETIKLEWKTPSPAGAKWVETRWIPLRNEKGTVDHMMGISRDLTELQQAKSLLRESEAWSRKVLDTTTDGFIRFNPQGDFIDVNAAYCQMAGYSRKELLAMRLTDVSLFSSTASGFAKNVERILNKGSDFFETYHRRKDGRVISFEVIVSHFKMNEEVFFAFVRDVTERKQMEREILEISARERQRIGYDLHDGLGQYLTGIAFKTKVLEEELAAKSLPQSADAAEIVGLVNNAIGQTRTLARLLAPVVVEANGLPAALENLTAETINLYSVSCIFSSALKGLTLDAKTGMELYRIAQEAVHNAVNRGCAKRVEIQLTDDHGQLLLVVRDNGKGFSSESKSRAGMGLRIMRYRASSVGGTLVIQSKIGEGTEVKCLLPKVDRTM